jgi:hypothetical protein
MANVNVEGKTPIGPQDKESLLPAAVSGYSRGLAVVYGADEYHATLAGAAAAAIGIIEEDALSLVDPVAVIEQGQAIAQIGASVSKGQSLATDANGRLVPAVATNPIVAVSLEDQTYVAPGSFACVRMLGSFGIVIHP